MIIIPNPTGSVPTAPDWRFRRDTRARARARQRLADLLWTPNGHRRLPTEAALEAAITALGPGDLWWVMEASSAGPLYFLPTVEWVALVAEYLDSLGVASVLEVACGDGFLSSCLRAHRPALRVVATDDGSWGRAAGRMTDADRALSPGVDFAGIRPGDGVRRQKALAAVEAEKPDLVLVSWAPPGRLVDRVIQSPSSKFVLDIGTDGDVCGNGQATWRFNKDFIDGPLEDRAFCRLDDEPAEARNTRITLYYGRAHPDFAIER
ncbi:MAG: hypothetical protein IV100_31305 [Myxococcales bacterium]|nr:hypothetical protein [Myxococcales bacterium]